MQRPVSIAPGEYYHLYNRGVDKRDIFLEEKDYERFLALLYLSNRKEPINLRNYFLSGKMLNDVYHEENVERLVAIGAYCLMPNHFHLLTKEIVDGGTSLFMKKLSTGYAMFFNTKYTRSGALFQGRFKSQHVDNDRYLKYLYSYIHLNPAKLVDLGWKEEKLKSERKTKEYVKTYPFSSYQYLFRSSDPKRSILSPNEFPDYFSKAQDVDEMIDIWLTKDRPL